jgi:hypothetical protein
MKKKKNVLKKTNGKNLKNFMKDEAGNMTKENILKMGLGTVAALSMFSGMSAAQCGPGSGTSPDHSNDMVFIDGSDHLVAYEGSGHIVPGGGLEVHQNHDNHCSY